MNARIAEMRAVGAAMLFPALAKMFADPDLEVRCRASLAALLIDETRGIDLVLPLLNDPDNVVRWHVCGLMHDFGNFRAVASLIERMRADPNPQVRGTAAWALGAIGDPAALPALKAIVELDHEEDVQGWRPSDYAKDAIDEILEKQK